MEKNILENVMKNMTANEEILSQRACKSKDAIKFKEDKTDIRPAYFKDIDRIIHSLSYTRYIDKTQVYSFVNNDHITHRVLHVQLVSKIARTIGRALRLNEDLIEAIALGHDVGHSPFGHKGERFLDNICRREHIGYFCHNAQSVRVLNDLEGLIITVQTLDGILAHNGEILLNKYEPDRSKTKEDLKNEVDRVMNIENYSKKIVPMTLEGCVVRISDIIAYIGRDIEDAIVIGSIKRIDIPSYIVRVLGNNNSEIVNTLILDIIENSYDKDYLSFSLEVFEALMKLKKWSTINIYNSKEATLNEDLLEICFNKLFDIYLEKLKELDYKNGVELSDDMTNSDLVFFEFINSKSEEYLNNTDPRRIVIDYIAGQTDNFFLKECGYHIEGFDINE